MKSRGLSAAPWSMPTFMMNQSLSWPFTWTQDLAFSYIALSAHNTHSSTPALLIAHQRTFLGARSKTFFDKSRQKQNTGFMFIEMFLLLRLMKIASVVPWPGIKPNCILLISRKLLKTIENAYLKTLSSKL